MIRDLIKWVVPGLATVLGGTTLCLAMTSTDIANDLQGRAAESLVGSGYDWAQVSVDARDLELSGTTGDEATLIAAIADLDAIAGVRAVNTAVTVAPLARPYVFSASVDASRSMLQGSVPDEATRQHFLAAGSDATALDLNSGMPNRKIWLAAADFAANTAKHFDQGKVVVSDLTLSVEGRVRSERDYRDLLLALQSDIPVGVTVKSSRIVAPLMSPYEWSATFDGNRIEVSGFVPDDATVDRLRNADVGAIPVATGVTLASGEPQGFSDLSTKLLVQLAKLEKGSASISGGTSRLTGTPPSIEVAQSVNDALNSAGSIITLDAPRISDYWMSATRQAGGAIVFDGYVPDEATRTAFSSHPGADVSYLKLGRGAPERYQSAADFGLALLDQMSEGRFSLRGDVLTLSGTARSAADYDALRRALAQGAPQGLSLAQADIAAPRAENFNWQVSKSADGKVTLSGLVPNPDVEQAILAEAGPSVANTMTYGSGEPGNFTPSVQIAFSVLPRLQQGSISLEGGSWTITGTASSAIEKSAIEADFTVRQLAASGWSMALAEPMSTAAVAQPAVEPAPEPVAEVAVATPTTPEPVAPSTEPASVEPASGPYIWSATKSEDGAIIVTGLVPANAFQRVMAVRGGDGLVDQTTIAADAPNGFAEDALVAIDALKTLSTGSANFDGTKWSVSGTLLDAAAQAQLDAAIALAPTKDWALSVAEAEPALPAPAAAPTAPAPVAAADVDACTAPVAAFSARNAISFQSGVAALATESEPALDELATDLAACPNATVHIEGHTDSDGDEDLNMALSVARAEAVVGALVTRGVSPNRLYAIGYGESLPIADNATSDGKRANRRIVVTVKAGQ